MGAGRMDAGRVHGCTASQGMRFERGCIFMELSCWWPARFRLSRFFGSRVAGASWVAAAHFAPCRAGFVVMVQRLLIVAASVTPSLSPTGGNP